MNSFAFIVRVSGLFRVSCIVIPRPQEITYLASCVVRRVSCVFINRKDNYPRPQHHSDDIRYHIIHIKRPVWQEILHTLGSHRQSYPRNNSQPHRKPGNVYAYKKPGEEKDAMKEVVETDLQVKKMTERLRTLLPKFFDEVASY